MQMLKRFTSEAGLRFGFEPSCLAKNNEDDGTVSTNYMVPIPNSATKDSLAKNSNGDRATVPTNCMNFIANCATKDSLTKNSSEDRATVPINCMNPIANCATTDSLAKNYNGDNTVSTISLEYNIHESHLLESAKEYNSSLIKTNFGRQVKQVDGCCSSHDGDNSGDGSDYQVLSTEHPITKRPVCQPFTSDPEELQKERVRKARKVSVSLSKQSKWFQKKSIIMAYVAEMCKENIFVDVQKPQCPLCKAVYQYKWALILHMITQHASLETDTTGHKKRCPHCNDSFWLDEQFSLHMNTFHYSKGQNYCLYCPFICSSHRVLYDHYVSTHFKNEEKIRLSQRVFVSAEEINKALQLPHQIYELRLCPFCPFKTTGVDVQRALLLHLTLFHLASERNANSQIKCCYCPREFQSDIEYRMHILAMHQQRGFQYCPFCPHKAMKLVTHIHQVHGSAIIIPNSSSRDTASPKITNDLETHSNERPTKSFPDEFVSHASDELLLVGQKRLTSQGFCSFRNDKAYAEWDNSWRTSPSSKLDEDQRHVKRHKTCTVDSDTSRAAPQTDGQTNLSSGEVLTVMDSQDTKPLVVGLLCDQKHGDPEERALTSQSNLNRLNNSAKFQTTKEHTCPRDDARQCPYCRQSVTQQEIYEHLSEHKLKTYCLLCNLQFCSPEELFEHTWVFHFKMHGKLIAPTNTAYYTVEALRQVLRKALLDLHVKKPSNTTLTHCPLCSFVCKETYNLKKYLSHHLVLHHLVTECTPQSNNIKCPHCSATFVSDPEFRNHLKVQHNASHTFYCPFCPFKCAAHLAFLLHDVTAIHGVHLLPEIRLDAKVLLRDNVASATAQRPLDSCDRILSGSESNLNYEEKWHSSLSECEEIDVKCEVEIDILSPRLADDPSTGCLGDGCFIKPEQNSLSQGKLNVKPPAIEEVSVKLEQDYQPSFVCCNHDSVECSCSYGVSVKSESGIHVGLVTQFGSTNRNFYAKHDIEADKPKFDSTS